MPVLGRSDPSRILTDAVKRIERLERRNKSSQGADTQTLFGAGSRVVNIQSRGNYTTPVAAANGSGWPPNHAVMIDWEVSHGDDTVVDLSDPLVHGAIGLVGATSATIYSVTGSVEITNADGSGATANMTVFPVGGNEIAAVQRGGVSFSTPLDAVSIAVPFAYTGPAVGGIFVGVDFDTAPSGNITFFGVEAQLCICKLT